MDSKKTHRLYLSETDIDYIVTLCRTIHDDSTKSILRRLVPIHARIKDGIATPYYERTSPTKAESFGFTEQAEVVDKRVMREAAYARYCAGARLSDNELQYAKDHAFANDLPFTNPSNQGEMIDPFDMSQFEGINPRR